MSNLLFALAVAAGLSLAGASAAQRYAPMSKDDYDAAMTSATTRFDADKAACMRRDGHARDLCVEEAKGRLKIAKADADAAFMETPMTREDARVARVEAAFGIAIERCDPLAGGAKDACVNEAQAALIRGKADAAAERTVGDARGAPVRKSADAHKATAAAAQEKRGYDRRSYPPE